MRFSNTRPWALLLTAGAFLVLLGLSLNRPFGWHDSARPDDHKADEGKPAWPN